MTKPAPTQDFLLSDVAVGRWTIDPANTQVRIRHSTFWGLMKVKGVFTGVTGSGEITANHSVTGTITVDAASIDTKSAKRDHHLRSSDFFDVETHPSFLVAIHSATEAGGHLELSGELIARGIRQPITLTAQVTSVQANRLAVRITGAVDRHRFGISGNQLGMIIGSTGLDIYAVFIRDAA